uniref:Uncharacterized protein n=1 Tax=Mycolicibacterium neoaurum VKM Ac-1815D TaxID=700508 RepID=V5XIS7_MYCNE
MRLTVDGVASIRSHVDIDCANGDVTATQWGDPGISRFDICTLQM